MKQEITFFARAEGQKKLFGSAASGLRKLGVKAYCSTEDTKIKTHTVACWGWRTGEKFRAQGRNVLVFERGYLGDRFVHTSIAWNGLNGRADFCLKEPVTGEKFNQNGFQLKPWFTSGKNIIIMGQVVGDMSLQGLDLTEFYEMKAKSLHATYGKDVYFKPHPQGIEKKKNFRPKVEHIHGTMDEVLANAFLVVTFNSNAGVDAVVNGIPALSFDIGSMAYEVTGHKNNDRITPEREQWAYKLAHCQWTPEEIANGDYWERMKCKLED